jgi:hypothetical protein
MIRKTKKGMQTINLNGEQVNPFYLLGVVIDLNKTIKLPNIAEIMEEMQQGDLHNLIKTVEKHSGEYLVIETVATSFF